ncbi:hypothetical protein F8M41_000504 [Gigaspora margarita]|uniref:Uncharacterized protein n=1 Tax=Gigaspora margarita TaxID=4874 RepID=A0A8H3XGK5_GIGMA|nr:hypothetical protein F8M41_000504 [Gigaspora margarita]
MVHRIFKNLVPQTNCKNIELDLLKQYTTLFAIRHLIDGGVDIRISKSNQGFVNISQDFKKLFSDWFITKTNNFIQLDQDIDIEDLEEKVPCQINNSEFRLELYLSYCDFGHVEALINTGLSFYEGVTYLVENSCNIIEKYLLYVGNIITIQEEEEESYAILRAIFRHKGNNGYFYPFIVIDWLEKTNQVYSLLECPIYKIQSEKN